MDKLIFYKRAARQVVEEVVALSPEDEDGVENQLITDDEHGHYLYFGVGWEGRRWFYASFIHIDVKTNGKVWLQHDGTDLIIADRLVEKGIPKEDIVIGFQSPFARHLLPEFAVG